MSFLRAVLGAQKPRIQANGNIEGNALGSNSVVVRGSGNRVAGAGAYGNQMGDIVQVAGVRGNVSIKADSSSIAAGVLNIDGPVTLPLPPKNNYVSGSRGESNIRMGKLGFQTSGNHIMLTGVEDDAIVTVNGRQVWPIKN